MHTPLKRFIVLRMLTSCEGFHDASNMMTRLAATKFIPKPPARVEIRKSLMMKVKISGKFFLFWHKAQTLLVNFPRRWNWCSWHFVFRCLLSHPIGNNQHHVPNCRWSHSIWHPDWDFVCFHQSLTESVRSHRERKGSAKTPAICHHKLRTQPILKREAWVCPNIRCCLVLPPDKVASTTLLDSLLWWAQLARLQLYFGNGFWKF